MIVMAGMQAIAATGRGIICTIHQPSTAIFEKFDSLLLMKRGGEVRISGAPDGARRNPHGGRSHLGG